MSGYYNLGGSGGSGPLPPGVMTAGFLQTFSVGDWVLQGDGSYKFLIPASSHGKTLPVTAETGILDGSEYDTVTVATEIDPSGNVEISVPDALDRFDGRVVIYGGG
jgi:hypothetical protein